MQRAGLAVVGLALALLVVGGAAAASAPHFKNPQLVVRKMEQHYNGADYKRRIRPSTLVRRVLCGHEDYGPIIADESQCTGRMKVQRADGKTVGVSVKWELSKLSAKRAKLRWFFNGPGVYDTDYEIVAPKEFGLTTW
jgi:hypothetical protein